jgi:hypothetical protein
MTLTEQEWAEVFRVRCRSKQGHRLNDEEFSILTAAWKSDPNRYKGLDKEVFEATLPAGSSAKWRGP